MSSEYEATNTSDDQRREFVLDFIRQRSLITVEDNLILSEKVFVINAVLKWCYERAHQKKMTPTLWGKYKKMIAQYIAGVVEIKWTDNNFETIEVTDDKDKPRTRRRNTRRTKPGKPK
jgi:hypothetical protein